MATSQAARDQLELLHECVNDYLAQHDMQLTPPDDDITGPIRICRCHICKRARELVGTDIQRAVSRSVRRRRMTLEAVQKILVAFKRNPAVLDTYRTELQQLEDALMQLEPF